MALTPTPETTFVGGDMLVSPSGHLVTVGERVERDRNWNCGGFRVTPLNMGTGDGWGYSEFLADYLIAAYRQAPTEWTPVPPPGGDLDERFVYDGRRNRWSRELRPRDAVETAGDPS
jgi:hypothetical protein